MSIDCYVIRKSIKTNKEAVLTICSGVNLKDFLYFSLFCDLSPSSGSSLAVCGIWATVSGDRKPASSIVSLKQYDYILLTVTRNASRMKNGRHIRLTLT